MSRLSLHSGIITICSFNFQSLGILAFIPAACLILTLVSLLMYFLTRCCDRKTKRKRTITACKWVTIVFIVLLTWYVVSSMTSFHSFVSEELD